MREHERYRQLLRRHVPDFPIESFERVGQGWDSDAFEVNGEWIFRFPPRPETEAGLRKEAALLPELGPALPVPVPEPDIVVRDGVFFVGHRKIEGRALSAARPGLAEQLAAFLSALHSFPVARAAELSVPVLDAHGALERDRQLAQRCERLVFPLLERAERETARAMFEEFFQVASNVELETVLIHADLGPEHILCRGDLVSGVIDWSDARVGDPALDFAWLLFGLDEPFAEALLDSYAGSRAADDSLRERALFYHRLGPWHEVLYGLERGGDAFVQSGLDGVRRRLPLRKYDRSA
jgi:aminoglycoside phosphotransferase (APT) family kinase protein